MTPLVRSHIPSIDVGLVVPNITLERDGALVRLGKAMRGDE